MHPWRKWAGGVALLALAGCGNDGGAAAADTGGGSSSDSASGDGAKAADAVQPGYTSELASPFATPAWAAQGWAPARVLSFDPTVRRRGLREVRGLIHAHTAYSHDACDGKPFDAEGEINAPCVEDFRRDLCAVGHDYVFMTDHPTHFKDHPFPDVLHYQEASGDALIQRDGVMLANRMKCPDGHTVVLIPGTEGGMMPVGLDGHIADPTERAKVYGGHDAQTREALIAAGAHVLAQHTEDWTPEQLGEKGWAGFEMYNLHANMMAHMNDAAKLFPILLAEGETMHPDLILVALVDEDPRYQETWARVAEAGHRRVTTMGTDCHRNTFNLALSDGERVDSYRRMMIWFSNHLLIEPEADGSFDDRHLEAALESRRLFGVFEVLGYAEGFDARIERAGDKAAVEIGGEASLKDGLTIVADTPHVARLPADAEMPEIWSRILLAKDGKWVEQATGNGRVSFAPTAAGAYRVEVRIRPKHLRKHLGSLSAKADADYAWVYANTFYVTE